MSYEVCYFSESRFKRALALRKYNIPGIFCVDINWDSLSPDVKTADQLIYVQHFAKSPILHRLDEMFIENPKLKVYAVTQRDDLTESLIEMSVNRDITICDFVPNLDDVIERYYPE